MLQETIEYEPPEWTSDVGFKQRPAHRVKLAQLPTPIQRWFLPGAPYPNELADVELYLKRDDMTASDVSGNKVRKLEFLMADCRLQKQKYDSVVTIGGTQSNHARATAVIARQLGYKPHLILRGDLASKEYDSTHGESLAGNLLYDRLVDSTVHPVSVADYVAAPGGYATVHDCAHCNTMCLCVAQCPLLARSFILMCKIVLVCFLFLSSDPTGCVSVSRKN